MEDRLSKVLLDLSAGRLNLEDIPYLKRYINDLHYCRFPYLAKIFLSGGIVGAVLAAIGISININAIPSTRKVQQGFIAPSKIEIILEDTDKNREPETYMKIGDVKYPLKEIDGKLIISGYKVVPAEGSPQIVPSK